MKHLDEIALEAMSSGREDLVSDEVRAHVEACEACWARVEHEREGMGDARVGLRRAMPELDDLDGLITHAMTVAAGAPSRRSLWVGGAIGGVASVALAILSLPGASITGLISLGRQGITLARALDSVVHASVPGAWIGVALVALVLALLSAIPVRFLLGERRPPRLLTGALGLLLAVSVSAPALSAQAYRVEGEWPERPVTLDIDERPTSEALRMASEAAGLGLIARLPEDPPVTLHVRDVPLEEVVHALLGDADVVVRPSERLLTVGPDMAVSVAAEPVEPGPVAAEPTEPGPVAADPAEAEPPEERAAALDEPAPASVDDRITFGGDAVVREGEVVRDVVTMGGDVRVEGRALGDVVTMGGDADVRGEVIGNVVTMGGNIRVGDGAQVHGDLRAMGGGIDVAEGAWVRGKRLEGAGATQGSRASRGAEDDDGGFASFFRWALWHALLFLVGLVLLGTLRERFVRWKDELASRPVQSGLGGLFGLFAGGVLCLVLCITIIGIPVAAILGAVLVIAVVAGWTSAALWLGSVLPLRVLKDRPVHQLGAGVIGLFIAGLVPFVGPLIIIAAVLAGFGAVMATTLLARPRRDRPSPTGPFR